MKARIKNPTDRVYVTETQIHHAVEAEIETIKKQIYKEAVQDITVQTLATVLVTLEQYYGWKEGRLKKFVEAIHGVEDTMVNPSPLHHRYTHLDNEQHIKEKYGIDLNAEFPTKCVDKSGREL